MLKVTARGRALDGCGEYLLFSGERIIYDSPISYGKPENIIYSPLKV
jgi:hypothetical protein